MRMSKPVPKQERDGRWTVQGDPTEGALVVAARKAGLEADALSARFVRVAEVPFSSERKLMSTIHTDAERQERLLVFTKGAPDILLARCSQELVGEENRPLTAERRAETAMTIFAEEFARAGRGDSDRPPSRTFELEHYCKDGSTIWLELNATFRRDADGNIVEILGVSRDIRERKRVEAALRESEERFRQSFDSAPIGMALVAPDGRWLQVNHALCEIVGYTPVPPENPIPQGFTRRRAAHSGDGARPPQERRQRFPRREPGQAGSRAGLSRVRGVCASDCSTPRSGARGARDGAR